MAAVGHLQEDKKNQWYIFLAYPDMTSLQSDGIGKRYRRRVQVPIVEFCEELAKQFESNSLKSEEKITKNCPLLFHLT